MNLQEITSLKKEVRIIDSTNDEEAKKMIGKEYKVHSEYYYDDTIKIYAEEEVYYFNRSDVRFLTPLSYKGKRIAIGDEVKAILLPLDEWVTIYGFIWVDGKWILDTVKDNDFKSECYRLTEYEITDHRTGVEEPEVEDEDILIKNGKKYKVKIIKEL